VDLPVLYGLSLFAEFIANDKPILVQYEGGYYTPIFNFYPETEFGGDFRTEAVYRDIEVQCLIISGGLEDCWDDPEGVIAEVPRTGEVAGEEINRAGSSGRSIPYSYNTSTTSGPVRALAAGREPLAGHRRHRARRAGAGDLRLPPVGAFASS
jgi:microcin C transport system permease protein